MENVFQSIFRNCKIFYKETNVAIIVTGLDMKHGL